MFTDPLTASFSMQTWMYLVVPIALYAFERTHPFFKGKDHRVSVIKVCVNNFFSLVLHAEAGK